ncbi:hypothetical protein L6466_01600 [Prevotella communis]|uniref:hypothetical protein n=1 Tax=Prevotella communis TaxID=2913614 RepID=UPI001EDC8397|nr:hypothetical protein [Prevotella communis]UKK67113.1 hypothetical protein L6464_10890 [Prevotella communis]UKK70748.1 hypothetical protein L6466_01600 [Prevotella communis]
MENFNITRFGQALKCHFLVSRKSWIRIFGIYTLVLFFANLFFTRVAGSGYSKMEQICSAEDLLSEYTFVVKETIGFGMVFFCFSMLFGASYLFSQMKDTRKRSAYLLWPVSNGEKYIISLLHSVILMAVITVVSIIAADALRVLIDVITGRVMVWGVPFYIDFFSSALDWQSVLMLITWMFYIHSLFIVGGTLFRRFQFLSTSAVILIVVILLTIVIKQTELYNIDYHFIEYEQGEIQHQLPDGSTYYSYRAIYTPRFYFALLGGWLIIAAHYWASFKLFCRVQVINNKWLNV